ncbi:hypothetical protein O181_007134 [Austropuccinia psidii MF-1]|uniref:Uncharacterized protein n=1 Tax=Austropuccinia psidii MF-1 TaxID=1389203 RepID=A0A9Q3BLD1_9BASI|nr:hypothetical protein [Austropuccinia psidii MF-1]
MGNSSKTPDRDNELIPSSEEALGPRKERGPSERLDSNVCQRASPKGKSLVEETKNVIRGSEEAVGPKERHHSFRSSSRLHKFQTKTNQKGKQKEMSKWDKMYPQNYTIPRREKAAMDNVFNMTRTLM